jgi:hypothetical protein
LRKQILNILDQAENCLTKKRGKTDWVFLLVSDSHKHHKNCHNQQVLLHNHVEKTLPQPLLLPNKPQNTVQIKNRAHNIAFWKTCAHKTPTTTTKRKTNSKKSRLVEFSFLKETFNNYQHEKNPFTFTTTTKQTKNRNPNQKQTSKNNQKKRFCTQTSYNNNQKENLKKGRVFTFITK